MYGFFEGRRCKYDNADPGRHFRIGKKEIAPKLKLQNAGAFNNFGKWISLKFSSNERQSVAVD